MSSTRATRTAGTQGLPPKLLCWGIRLSEYHPTIRYRMGSQHQSVDALTRDPTYSDDEDQEEATLDSTTANQLSPGQGIDEGSDSTLPSSTPQ
eukprot:gene1805-2138_t